MNATQPAKVLYLCEFTSMLGAERSLLTFLDWARDRFVDPAVVAPAGGPLADALRRLGVPRLDWPAGSKAAVHELAELAKPLKPQLVHANSLMTADAGLGLSELLGVPSVAHVRDIMRLSRAQVQRLSRHEAIIAVSDAVAESLVQQGVQRSRVVRVYNAVDADSLRQMAKPGRMRSFIGAGETTDIVACVGQIALRKGQDVFLKAAECVARRRSDVKFVLMGTRYSDKQESIAYEQRLVRQSSRPPLAGKCHWLGFRPDAVELMADCTVVVVPSRQEPLSRVLLEAAAIGVATVATNVGGSAEILDGGRCGLLVRPDAPDELADAIDRLCKDEKLRTELCERAYARVVELFHPELQTRRIAELYQEGLSRN